jgi:dolichyldiphosphatase
MALKATSATCVMYASGDSAAKILAYASLVAYAALLFTACVAYNRRQVPGGLLHACVCLGGITQPAALAAIPRRHIGWMLVMAGFVINELVARILKRILNQARPAANCIQLDTCNEPGMPSSHTACMAFAAALRICNWTPPLSAFDAALAVVECCGLMALAVITAVSRVYLGYHTVPQVLAGAALGAVFGLAWSLVLVCLRPARRRVVNSSLGHWLHLADDGMLGSARYPASRPKAA